MLTAYCVSRDCPWWIRIVIFGVLTDGADDAAEAGMVED